MVEDPPAADERILVLAPTGRDGRLIAQVMRANSFECIVCESLPALAAKLRGGAGLLLIAEEALTSGGLETLVAALADEPPWSDITIGILTFHDHAPSGDEVRRLDLANVVLIERPLRMETLLSVVRSGLRARRKQYQVRANIAEREAAQRELRDEKTRLETLNRLSPVLAGTLSLRELVQSVTDAATSVSNAAFGAFFYNLNDEKGESYMLYALAGAEPEAFAHLPMPRNTLIFAPTFRGEGILRIGDVRDDPRYGQSAPYFGMPEGHLPVRSYLAVPVVTPDGEVLGGLFFAHPRPNVFTEESERLVGGIAAQAATGLRSARLYEEVRLAGERHQTLVEALPQLVWTAAPDGSYDHLSGQWIEYTGRAEAEGLGDGWLTAIHSTDREHAADAWQRAIADEETYDVEVRIRRADGEFRWFKSVGRPVRDASGRVVHWFGASTDINEQKEAEYSLQRASAMKDELLALVSHELRTPLTKILGASDILKRRSDVIDEETRQELIASISSDGIRLQRLIENMLVLSKGETVSDVSLEPVLLQRIVTHVVQDFSTNGGHGELKVALPPNLPPVVGNATFIEQVVSNLVRNSEKYADLAHPIEVSADATETSVVCCVRDRGRLLTEEQVTRMFSPFYRDPESAIRTPGLGLGLPVCARLVEAQGGRLRASPREGGGLAVVVELLRAEDE